MPSLCDRVERAETTDRALAVVREQLARAIAAPKCHGCGCLRHTIEALDRASAWVAPLRPMLDNARRVLVAQKYECLGCDVCHPAVAANVLADAFPNAMDDTAHRPTESRAERSGWPPLPGEYSVIRYRASVAVCTLNDEALARTLAAAPPEGLAIVGTMRTENLGIERVIRNVLANPNIRFLLLCGDDTRQRIGHLPGQSIEALFANGIDDDCRIVGARGKRPLIKNISNEHIGVFRRQVEVVSMIGERNAASVAQAVIERHARGVPAHHESIPGVCIDAVRAEQPQFYRSDPAGFFVVYPDRRANALVVEHYTNAGVLDCVVVGSSPAAVYVEVIERRLVGQLDHAAYLGRELESAWRSLHTGERYVQDRAAGEPVNQPIDAPSCGFACTSCH